MTQGFADPEGDDWPVSNYQLLDIFVNFLLTHEARPDGKTYMVHKENITGKGCFSIFSFMRRLIFCLKGSGGYDDNRK
jgi:hypothetical protein